MKSFLSSLITLFILSGFIIIFGFAIGELIHGKHSYKDNITYVVDGDTFHLRNSGDVRLKRIDAYEIGTKKGQKAKGYVHKLIEDCDWIKVITKDKHGYYNRLLAEVENCRGVNIGTALLTKGYAEIYKP